MARGVKKHQKRLNAPRHWMLGKLGGIWAPRPSTGPHKRRECLPLSLILRNRLKYSLTRRETIMIVMRRHVEVDKKIRTDINYPAGFMDTVEIRDTNERFRLLYDVKGRFVLHRIAEQETNFKLLRVQQKFVRNKASIGQNKLQTGQQAAIPAVVTHDGRTLRFADPAWQVNDTLRFDLTTGKVTGHFKFEIGQLAMITRGANVGRVGEIVGRDKHPGSFEIIHLKDKRGQNFATRVANVFVIGDGKTPAISLPKQKGLVQSVIEERDAREKNKK
jgi:small subunit ribosomal protein S4e